MASSYPGTGFGWGTEQVVLDGTGASDDYKQPVISRDSSSYVWVASIYTASDYVVSRAIKETGTTNDLPESSGDTVYSVGLQNSTDTVTSLSIASLGISDMYLTYSQSGALSGCRWDNDDSGGRWEDSSNNPCTDPTAEYGGMLVYCDDATDVIKYRILDSSGAWSTAGSAADIDGATSDRRCERTQVYANPNSSEKILLSIHNDGTTAYIYSQVWDGSSWGNVQFLASPPFSSVWSRKADGAYMANGNFMTIYADSTTIPKFAIWDGDSWESVGNSTQDIGHDAFTIISHARPGTNEIMTVIHDSSRDATSIYYDGSGTATTDFTYLEHASDAPSSNGYHIDFAWSTNNPLRGAYIYTNASGDTSPVINIFTADGVGGGSWGTPAENQTLPNSLGAQQIVDRPGANEFLTCNNDLVSNITCFEESDNDTSPTLQTTTNGTISTAVVADDDSHSFDLAYEQQSGDLAIAVYSDNTSVPKLKTYNPATNTWDASPISLTSQSNTIKKVDAIPDPSSDDIMIIIRDTSLDIHTIVWDGANNQLYSSGGRANVEHTTNCGGFSNAHCADFAWNLNGSVASVDTINASVADSLTENHSLVSDSSGQLHLITISSTGNLLYYKFTTSWQTAVTLDSNSGNTYPTISLDTATDDVYVFWVRDDDIFYKMGESPYASDDWDVSATSWQTTGTNVYITSSLAENNEIFVLWEDGTTITWDKLTLTAVVSFTQNKYRFYVDNDLTNPTEVWGTPDLAENTAIVVVPTGNDPPSAIQELRLRVNMLVSDAALSISSKYFKLQFKAGTDGSCTSGSWTDVGTGAWSYATSSVTDGENITAVLSDTTTGKGQQYVKSKPSALNNASASISEIVEYDFHIVGTSSNPNTQYSFRVVETSSDGSTESVFDGYTNCPTLMTEPGTADLLRHGQVFTEGVKRGFTWVD